MRNLWLKFKILQNKVHAQVMDKKGASKDTLVLTNREPSFLTNT
jgi:hypothetical protein